MNRQGTTYWITGLSGAGKTTVGKKLYNYLLEKNAGTIFLDGDMLRQVFQNTDYSREARISLTYHYSRLCRMLNEQGIDIVICVISMYDECRQWNRENIPLYREVYLKVDIEELIRRDQKQLYSRALRNEISDVLGINQEFEEPKTPDLVIHNGGDNAPERSLQMITEKFDL